jgi:hypothetical protein
MKQLREWHKLDVFIYRPHLIKSPNSLTSSYARNKVATFKLVAYLQVNIKTNLVKCIAREVREVRKCPDFASRDSEGRPVPWAFA